MAGDSPVACRTAACSKAAAQPTPRPFSKLYCKSKNKHSPQRPQEAEAKRGTIHRLPRFASASSFPLAIDLIERQADRLFGRGGGGFDRPRRSRVQPIRHRHAEDIFIRLAVEGEP